MSAEACFQLSDEQRMFADSLERFLGDIRGQFGADTGPGHWKAQWRKEWQEQWQALAEFGVLAAVFDEKCGGFGGSGADIMVVFEVLGRMGFGTTLIDLALLPGCLFDEAGRDIQQILAGQERLVFAHGETDSRYDLGGVETEARHGRLTGYKSVVVSAPHGDGFLVSARDEEAGEGVIGLWMVHRDAPGLTVKTIPLRRVASVAIFAFTIRRGR